MRRTNVKAGVPAFEKGGAFRSLTGTPVSFPDQASKALKVLELEDTLTEITSKNNLLGEENRSLKTQVASLSEQFNALLDKLSKWQGLLRKQKPKYRQIRKSLKEEQSKRKQLESELKELQKTSAKVVAIKNDQVGKKNATFLERACQLHRVGRVDASLDIVYDNVDALLMAGKYGDVNSLLESLDEELLATDILLALLTATLPAKGKLCGRSRFFKSVEAQIKKRKEWEDGLLIGLES